MAKGPPECSTPGVTRVVTPLGVLQMRGQIYLSAFCHQSSCDKTFRLDRIASYRSVKWGRGGTTGGGFVDGAFGAQCRQQRA
ncbi:MAG: WYL domain-containing protein [Planctomycetes bacterium]|nr:WYL domain-containing protein [Planctomycetota bacterium]